MREYSDQELWDFMDGSLSEDSMKDIQSKLEGDPQLKGRLDELKSLDGLLRKTMFRLAPLGIEDSVLARLEERKSSLPNVLLINDFQSIYILAVFLAVSTMGYLGFTYLRTGQINSSFLFLSVIVVFTLFCLVAVDQVLTFRKIKKKVGSLGMTF